MLARSRTCRHLGCCKPLDGAFVDRQFFSRNLSFLTRKDDLETVKAFDYALDRLQEKRASAKIFLRKPSPAIGGGSH